MLMSCCCSFARHDPLFRKESQDLGFTTWCRTEFGGRLSFVPGVLHHVFNQAACAQQPRFLTRWPANATNIIGRSKSQAALDIPIATKSIHLPSSEPNQLAIPHTAKKTTEKEQLPPTQRTCNWCCSPFFQQAPWQLVRNDDTKACQQRQGQALHHLGWRISPWEAWISPMSLSH